MVQRRIGIPSETPAGVSAEVPVERLLLDPENPRLASTGAQQSQEDLVRILWVEMAVDEVALSIAHNGYYRQEPLLVIAETPPERDEQKRKYTVVEGNRRLAAVLLLRDTGLRQRIRATELPVLSTEARARLNRLPVLIYPNRESLWAYLGFRHINGTKPWDSLSKAMYVANVHENFQIPLEEVAGRIGDRHATVVRLYRGYKILEQAEQQAEFSREDSWANRFAFSHLYTAADQIGYQKFLGISPESSLRQNPVPKSKLENLTLLMTWLYGRRSDSIQPIVRTQNPDLKTLREVISKPQSLAALRAGYSLERAHEISVGDKSRFREKLTAAKEELQQAKATVTTGYAGEDDLFQIAADIVEYADSVHEEMQTKRASLTQKRR
jgi:hypothetical protein